MINRKIVVPAIVALLLIGLGLLCLKDRGETPVSVTATQPVQIKKKHRQVRQMAVKSETLKKFEKKPGFPIKDPDPPSTLCFQEAFDEESGLLHQAIDENCDGQIDACQVSQMNEYGEVIHQRQYEGCGDKPSACDTFLYNEYGECVEYKSDEDCDGQADTCGMIERNEYGDEKKMILVKESEGSLDEKEFQICYSYDYDADGLIIGCDWEDCQGKKMLCFDYEYDFAKGIRREKSDLRCEGQVITCSVDFLDDQGETVGSFQDRECDGTWDMCSCTGFVSFGGGRECENRYDEMMKERKK